LIFKFNFKLIKKTSNNKWLRAKLEFLDDIQLLIHAAPALLWVGVTVLQPGIFGIPGDTQSRHEGGGGAGVEERTIEPGEKDERGEEKGAIMRERKERMRERATGNKSRIKGEAGGGYDPHLHTLTHTLTHLRTHTYTYTHKHTHTHA
jgi:hypothetical protein